MTDPQAPAATQTRFCRDCRYVKRDYGILWLALVPIVGWIAAPLAFFISFGAGWEYAECGRALRNSAASLVSGKAPKPEFYYCFVERGSKSESDCGASGRFFEPKRADQP